MKPPVRSVKMVAKSTKKVIGVLNKVTKEGFVHQQETNMSTNSPRIDTKYRDGVRLSSQRLPRAGVRWRWQRRRVEGKRH